MESYEHANVEWAEKGPWKSVTSGNITLVDASLYYATVVGFYWDGTSMKDTNTSAMLNAWKNLYPATSYMRWFGHSVRKKLRRLEEFLSYSLRPMGISLKVKMKVDGGLI